MAVSTVHAPPKKGGAGGAFTWGSATDTSMDFDASRVQQPVKVMTGAPVVQQTVAPSAPFTANLASAQQFPSLGNRTATAPVASAWTARPPVVTAAPQVTASGTSQPVTTMPPTVLQPTVRPVVMQPAASMGASTRTVTTGTPQTIQPLGYSASYPMPTYAAPVAAPRVIKEVPEKDRRSRMAYSTYHQEPKKGGAGGAFTWGSAGDVQDYDPSTVQVIESKVTTATVSQVAAPSPASPFTGNISSAQQFPSLSSGGQPGTHPSPWTAAPASIKEPPPGPSGTTPAGSPALAASPAPVPAVASPALIPAADPAPADGTEKEGKNCSIQ
eukprot:CAMPEP_0114693266 /NCGR_PEP_ID=MMETSP0191-20121206/68855_1 /TAXON_ID=126664 /ORGANISM="Sorites sp." /LENGTH=327 /DNA_ID=CAMNT_0001986675 /DNA_START=125 /DNA_END=1108 /DNA_ORIENTATION=+